MKDPYGNTPVYFYRWLKVSSETIELLETEDLFHLDPIVADFVFWNLDLIEER